ncbi:MarR family winged helix-turn-helix transcriptional regulator [Actibacterium sp. XHP0104]|uniref:MarR family winged helix-turn-helix transcriptional regulator n=1 Tax=Actibacterium sp. XHP0104 TaxID=2984335 RepID=UPI0021E8633A|nr:MarR family winged helix-turn-helix transcriptional regulator [Actibacterium sp. XHP0104]MCV2881745.1 MarR family winged helix-turn-helix transcriptional regulator [Actibacterium sp. XHP0104]
MEQFALDRFLPYVLSVTASRISKEFASRYRTEFGLSIPEWRVLAHLSQASEVSVREIHRKVDMDKSKVSRAATRLESAGYIHKVTDSADRRLVKLSLTPAGHDLIGRIIPIANAYQSELLTLLGDHEADFRAYLDKLVQR